MKLTKQTWRIGTLVASVGMSALILYSAQHWLPYTTCVLGYLCWMLGYADGRVDESLFLRDDKIDSQKPPERVGGHV